MEADSEQCRLVLQDPVVRSVLPAVYSSYSAFFSLHELQLARDILNQEDPWSTLEAFSLYSRYEDMIRVHVQNSSEIEILAFIGCGPLPITLLLFNKLYGIKCIGVEKDPEVAALAKRCVKHFGLENEIKIVVGDETVLLELEWDSVLIAGLAEPKPRIFQNLHQIIRQRGHSKKPISVCYRNYTGMRQLLYWPVRPEHTLGFRKIKEIYPSGKVNNTLVFLECE